MKLITFRIAVVLLVFNQLTAQDIPYPRIDMMLTRGNYDYVIDTCRQILHSDSLNPEIWYKIGIAYHNILEEDLSLTCFSRAVAIDPDNKAYNFMLAKGYYGKNKYSLAETLLTKICASDSMRWIYSYYLTSIYMHDGRYNEAIKIYKRFLNKDSTNIGYLNKIAFATLKTGDLDYAKYLYSKSLSLNEKNPLAIKNLAYLYSVTGNPEKSIQLLTKGIETDSSDIDLFIKRAQLYYSGNDNRNALNDYLVVLSSGDSSEIYIKRVGICYTNMQQFTDAVRYLLIAYRIDSSDYRICSYLGFSYYNLKDYKKSVRYYNKSIELLTPANIQLGLTYRYLAASQTSNRMYRNAISSYHKSLAIKSDPNLYMQIANLYDEKLKNPERAIYYYQKFLENYKNTEPPTPAEYTESIKNRIEYLKNNPAR